MLVTEDDIRVDLVSAYTIERTVDVEVVGDVDVSSIREK
jgi:hypothetical protein